jgi:HAE1 family hydrophobic/amphiphilic exporter-1
VAQIYQAITDKLTEDKTATTVTLKDNDMDVVLKDERSPLTKKNLLDLKIPVEKTKQDGTVVTKKYRLGKFADYKERDSVASISHRNGSKQISVTAETVEGYNTTLLSRKLEKKLDAIDVPEGYNISVGGESEDVEKMLRDMLLMMLVAVILVYLIMVAQFTGFLSPFIIMFTIPLAFTGGFLALMISGLELSMVALMGFLMLSGIIVNNGIVFIDYTNQLRRSGVEKRTALVEAGQSRMRPILMTAFTTILSMSAIALSQDPGAEMSQGMAVVVIGGLLYATLMTLFIVPTLYDLLYRKAEGSHGVFGCFGANAAVGLQLAAGVAIHKKSPFCGIAFIVAQRRAVVKRREKF